MTYIEHTLFFFWLITISIGNLKICLFLERLVPLLWIKFCETILRELLFFLWVNGITLINIIPQN